MMSQVSRKTFKIWIQDFFGLLPWNLLTNIIFLVIGGGITGLTAAYLLKKEGKEFQIIIALLDLIKHCKAEESLY